MASVAKGPIDFVHTPESELPDAHQYGNQYAKRDTQSQPYVFVFQRGLGVSGGVTGRVIRPRVEILLRMSS